MKTDNSMIKIEELNNLSERIIGAANEVSNTLGTVFLENVYEKALIIELKQIGIPAENSVGILVEYKNESVGEYNTDILVEKNIIVMLKEAEEIDNNHKTTVINYLRATNLLFGILIKLGELKVQIKQILNTNYPLFNLLNELQ